jgi:hypothetical protein
VLLPLPPFCVARTIVRIMLAFRRQTRTLNAKM